MSKLISHKPFSCFVNTGLYNNFYAKRIRKEIAKIEAGGIYINIETTNACNADCLMCPHSKMKRAVGTMKEEVFKKIVDSVVESGIEVKEFVLSGFGEPFADKNILERIAYVKSKGPFFVKLFSNASLLDKNRVHKVFESGLDEIVISFNGITKEIYEQVMKLPYEKSLENTLLLIKERKRRFESGREGSLAQVLKPKIVLSCVRLEKNKDEVRKFNEYWKGKADEILKPIPENWSGNMDQKSPWKYDFKKKMWPCRGMWDSLDFTWDGRVILCCRDYDGAVIIGDISKSSVKEILQKKRELGVKQLEKGDYSDAKICFNCDTMGKNAISYW
ncbi:MAG: radical SAM/SPASM domain-containing protein [Candidatus Firestonebacteria bacterium]